MVDTGVKEVRGQSKSKLSNGMKTRPTTSVPFSEPGKEENKMEDKVKWRKRNSKNEFDKENSLSTEKTNQRFKLVSNQRSITTSDGFVY